MKKTGFKNEKELHLFVVELLNSMQSHGALMFTSIITESSSSINRIIEAKKQTNGFADVFFICKKGICFIELKNNSSKRREQLVFNNFVNSLGNNNKSYFLKFNKNMEELLNDLEKIFLEFELVNLYKNSIKNVLKARKINIF